MNKEIKKVFVFVPSLKGGGAERVAVRLANAMSAKGLDVSLLVATDHGRYWDQVAPSVSLVRLRARRAVFCLIRLLSLIRSERPDVVLSTLKASNVLLVLLKPLIPRDIVVAIREASVYRRPRSIVDYFYVGLQRLFYRRADVFIVNSDGTLRSFASSGIRLPTRVEKLFNPIYDASIERFAAAPCNHPWVVNKETKLIVAIGRLVPEKGFETLLEAVSLLISKGRDVRCVIIGEGPLRESLIAQATSLGIAGKVDFAGFLENPFSLLKHADVFVLSSHWEGFGNVIVEALALNVPVVATDCPGGPVEILEHGKWGVLVPVAESRSLASAIEGVLLVARRFDLKQRALDFDVDRIASEYLAVFARSRLDKSSL